MDPIWLNDNNITAPIILIINGSTDMTFFDQMEVFDAPIRTFLVCLYSVTSFIAFAGNLIVIIVEIFGQRSAINLRKLLINLAISDIFCGVFSVPFTYTDFMLGRWIFPLWLCPVSQFVQMLSVFVTSFTLTIISIERYFAIRCPLSHKTQWFTDHCNIILSIGWILGSVLGFMVAVQTRTVPFIWNNTTYYDCRADRDEFESKLYSTSVFISTFAIPLVIQIFTYASIIKKLVSDRLINNVPQLSRTSRDTDRAKIIRMLVAVMILFFICWFPIRLFMLLIVFWPDFHKYTDDDDDTSYNTYFGSYFFSHWLAMANSFVNPIIYSFMSKSFRVSLHHYFI